MGATTSSLVCRPAPTLSARCCRRIAPGTRPPRRAGRIVAAFSASRPWWWPGAPRASFSSGISRSVRTKGCQADRRPRAISPGPLSCNFRLHAHRPTHPLVHGVGDPRDDPARERARGHQPRSGVPELRRARHPERGRGAGDSRRREPVRHHLGGQAAPGRARPQVRGLVRDGREPGDRDYGHVRCHRFGSTARDRNLWYGMAVNPETEITVTCGATEAMASALLAIVDPGDEVIVFEPFYENYGPDAILCGAKPV